MTLIAIAALVAVAALVVFLARRRPSGPSRRQASQQRPRQRVSPARTSAPAALVLVPGQEACDAARHLNARRFPPSDAPKLPLPTCNSGRCDCVFYPLDNQRKNSGDTDRRLGVGLQSELYLTTGNRDRRRTRGRRKTDRPG